MATIERPDGTTIHYDITGSGPPLLMLAGGAVNSEAAAWERDYPGLVGALANSHAITTMDQRYAGLSTGPNAPFSYEAMTGDQVAVLQAAGVDGAIVAGVGIGANYALRLACLEPGLVSAAVLVAPYARLGTAPPTGYRLYEETCRLARAEGLDAVIASARANPGFDSNPGGGPYAARLAADEEFVAETVRKGRERYIARVIRFRDGMFPADNTFFSVPDDAVRECKTPLVIAGGGDDLHPEGAASLLKEWVPSTRVVDRARFDTAAGWEEALGAVTAEAR